MNHSSEILLYQTANGETKIDVRLEDETVWLNQKQMADLFQTTVPNINMHLKNIFEEGELYQMQLYYDPKAIRKNVAVSANRIDLISCSTHHQLAHEVFQFLK